MTKRDWRFAMKIKDLHSKKVREAENLKLTKHKEYDKKGKLRINDYVEFTIIGNNSKWKDFMSLKDFKRLNPKIKI